MKDYFIVITPEGREALPGKLDSEGKLLIEDWGVFEEIAGAEFIYSYYDPEIKDIPIALAISTRSIISNSIINYFKKKYWSGFSGVINQVKCIIG